MSDVSILKRPSESRGRTELSWLQSRHSFSFGDFFDPEFLGFCQLRIINEDIVDASYGFGMHPHHSMEIFSYVIRGTLRHEDSEGNQRTISAGDFQYISAGAGVMHSEVNPSTTDPVHFLQIWIEPSTEGGKPDYQEIAAREKLGDDSLTLLASGDGREDSIQIRQTANIWLGKLDENSGPLTITPRNEGRNFWIQIIDGDLDIENNQEFLLTGDGAAISSQEGFVVKANEVTEFLLFELA